MGTTFKTYSTTEGHKEIYKTERQILEESIKKEKRRVLTYLLVFRFLKKIDGLKLGDKGREKAYEIAKQIGLNFYFRGYSDKYESTNYIYTQKRTFQNWNFWFEPEADLSMDIGYGRKAIKIDYAEICRKEFYRSVTVLKKSINAKQAALRTNKPEQIDLMETQLKELQEQINKNKSLVRGT